MAAKSGEAELSAEQLRERQEQARDRLNALKVAYLNSQEFDGHAVSYDDLKAAAHELIKVNYALQRALYGAIRLKLSVAKLLRRGR